MENKTVTEKDINSRLDNYIVSRFYDEYGSIANSPLTRSKVQNFIEDGKIKVNGKIEKPSYKIKTGDCVTFEIKKEEEFCPDAKNIPLNIVYEDDCLIVLNKQKGLICHPTSNKENDTLVNALLYHTSQLSDIEGKIRQGIVHRLDRDTTGLMLIAKTNEAHQRLKKDIQDKKTVRKYKAICHGTIEEDCGIIDKPLVHYLTKTVKMHTSEIGQSAITRYKVIKRFNGATLLDIQLETGRTHQIRCHFASLNHPLLGDKLYGAGGFNLEKKIKTCGQVLESYYLSFTHPKNNEIMEFETEDDKLHPDFKKVINYLKEQNNG